MVIIIFTLCDLGAYLPLLFLYCTLVVGCFSHPARSASIDFAMGDHLPVPVWHNRVEKRWAGGLMVISLVSLLVGVLLLVAGNFL